jgi:hypothetical protein
LNLNRTSFHIEQFTILMAMILVFIAIVIVIAIGK